MSSADKNAAEKIHEGQCQNCRNLWLFSFQRGTLTKTPWEFSLNGVHYRYLSIILKVFIIKALLVIYKMMYTKVISKSSSDFKKLR